MNLDPTQIMLLALLVSMGADKLFVGYLISIIARGQRAPSFPPVAPPIIPPVPVGPTFPVPPGPVVAPPVEPAAPPVVQPSVVAPPVPPAPPAPGIPRFTGITTTSFAGVNDSETSKESAYYPGGYPTKVIDSTKPGAALPYHFPGTPPVIRVFCRGKTVDCPIVDVGPWNTHDTYWDTGSRPQAETGTDTTGRHTNRAGLDLTPGAWAALDKTGNLDAVTDITSWDFVTVLDKGNVAPPVSVPPIGPTQPPAVGGTILQKNDWPAQSDAMSFFGNPASAGWEKANLVTVQCPWQLISEGVKSAHNTITIHRKCADSLTRVLNYIWEQAGRSQAVINDAGYNVFDGSYNYRPIAGTSTLSEHAYGGALDFNAAGNPQYATAANSKFKANGVIVQAFKAEGWTWGGDWSPAYRDAMHFQALRT